MRVQIAVLAFSNIYVLRTGNAWRTELGGLDALRFWYAVFRSLLRILPTWSLGGKQLPVFLGRHVKFLAEILPKMGGIGAVNLAGDLGDGEAGIF